MKINDVPEQLKLVSPNLPTKEWKGRIFAELEVRLKLFFSKDMMNSI